jgi:hypothetical protein
MRDPMFDKLMMLDRLEELLEEMAELGVVTRDDVEARIRELEAEIDDATDDSPQNRDADGSV